MVGAEDIVNRVGQVPVAFVIAKENADKDKLRIDIMKSCERHLPTYSYPDRIIFIEELPYTSAGKVDYRALEQMLK